MNIKIKGLLAVPIVAALFAPFAGWVNNIIWTFHQSVTVDLILGIVGIFVFPVGAVHGIYLWF